LADIRSLMILGIVFADSLAFIGIIVAIIAKFI
jgi:F0F1-type ATP synthase membrane subunit c/vacuolar-type H+-ATPase subunit K